MKNFAYKVSAAGRVNLIGEHIDYCGGKVLPCALSLKNTVYISPNNDNCINVEWTTLNEKVSMPIDRLADFKSHDYAKYIAGSAYFWREAGHVVKGCDIKLDCTVPFGGGLSSSAAIEVSVIAALATVAGEPLCKTEIAQTAQKAEHLFAGVNCGIMDQYASACGKKDHAMLLDCKTLQCDYIPVCLEDCRIVVIDSRKPHSLADSKYNERRAETDEALRVLQRRFDVSCLAEISMEQLEQAKNLLSDVVYLRAKHVVSECERVSQAAKALIDGDAALFGSLLNQSHRSLSELYQVTGKELDALAAIAQNHPACFGSRMTGAGFGGSTVSLVKSQYVKDFGQYVLKEYKKQTGYEAKIYETEISDGIIVEKL